MSLYQETNQSAKKAIAEDGYWLNGVPAIVADNQDPEKQHRVRVIIPSIDEDLIFDEWARQMVFCLGNGFGSAFIPPKGSEVVLFGQLGQKYNLFYASLYNEEMLMPNGYENEMTVGIHAPGNLIFIAEQLAKLQGQNVDVIAEHLARILAQNIEITAEQDVEISGNNVKTDATQLAELKGNQINLDADGQMTIHGATVSLNSDGSITISGGGSVQITGASIKLFNRTVNPIGPPI